MSKIKEGFRCNYYDRMGRAINMYTLDRQILIGNATRQVGHVFFLTPVGEHYTVCDGKGYEIGTIHKDLLVYFTEKVVRRYDTL